MEKAFNHYLFCYDVDAIKHEIIVLIGYTAKIYNNIPRSLSGTISGNVIILNVCMI